MLEAGRVGMKRTRLFVLGLTGGIASGKSAVSEILSGLGGHILDADKIHHENMQKGGPAYMEITAEFGPGIIGRNCEIDRSKLAAIVFADGAKLSRLNELSHKHVNDTLIRKITGLNAVKTEGFIVIDAPLLIEAGEHKFCDEVWVVDCALEQRIERLRKRSGFSREEAMTRINRQMGMEDMRKYADAVIDNSGTQDELRAVIKDMYDTRIAAL
jgi:dephospho-CoA kinase